MKPLEAGGKGEKGWEVRKVKEERRVW